MTTQTPRPSALDECNVRIFGALATLEAEWLRRVGTRSDEGELARALSACVDEWEAPLRSTLDAAYAELTRLAEAGPPETVARALAAHRRIVQPFFLQSPFCRRGIDKPLGYAGDYGLVEMIFAGREEARTPLGVLLGRYALQVGPSAAHRGRMPWAHRQLDALLRAAGRDRPRVLSFACGPEVVLREWVRQGGEGDLVLADHDREALAWAKKRLGRAMPPGNGTTTTTVEANAFAIVRGQPALDVLAGQGDFDVVLVLGLLDYLDDPQVVAFLRGIAAVIRPGGALLTSNLCAPNPWRALMEFTADWNVVHRTVGGFEALVRESGAFGEPVIELHESGTNLYCRATRVSPRR